MVETAREGVLASPKSGAAWGRLGQAFDAAEFPGEARTCYERAEQLAPDSPKWPHLLGLLQLQEFPDAALESFARAVSRSAASNDAPRVRLAQALVERGRFAEAEGHLASLMQVRPEHPAARLEFARIRLAEGRPGEASDLLAPCLTNPYTARPAVLLLSQVRARSGDAAGAASLAGKGSSMPRPFDWPDPFLREVQDLGQDRARMVERVNRLMVQRRLDEAETLLRGLEEGHPDDAEVILVAGRLRQQRGQCVEAEALFRRHLGIQPRSLNGHIQLGLALMCQSRWGDAADVFQRVLEEKPDFAQAHFNLGLARSKAGDSAGAIRSFWEALRCHPGDARTHLMLSEELTRMGREDEARQHRARARELNVRDAGAGPGDGRK